MPQKTNSDTAKTLATSLIVILALNVLFQMVIVHFTPLSRWQGGGFGMYTDPHPYNRTVSISSMNDERLYTVDVVISFEPETHDAFWDILPFPTKKKAQKFFDLLTSEACNRYEDPLDNRLCVNGGEFKLEVRAARVEPSDMSIVRDLVFSAKVTS